MEFKEINTISLPSAALPIVYFLIKSGEVVYVGQSQHGIARPYSHRDKDFDRIEIMKVPPDKLNETESYYIRKYAPIYNHRLIDGVDVGINIVKSKIQEQFNRNDFSIIYLRKLINFLNISTYDFDGITYISKNDFNLIMNFIKENLNGLRSKEWKYEINHLKK